MTEAVTDTVNVSRAWLRDAFLVLANDDGPLAKKLYEDVQAWLAAAPKAEPVDAETAMVNEMNRQSDYEAMTVIADYLRDNPAHPYSGRQCEEHVQFARDALYARPEAPKVEQEPVGYADPRVLAGMKSGRYADVTVYPTCGTASNVALYTHPAPSSDELPASIRDIAAERQRQVLVEGWSWEDDDLNDLGELAVAGACYALTGSLRWTAATVREIWPKTWSAKWLKPKPSAPRRDLVKAGALIAAEIERLDRLAQHKGPQS